MSASSATIPRDAQARLTLAAALRGHRVAVPGHLYADVDGEFLYAFGRGFVLRVAGGGVCEFVPAVHLASAEVTAPDLSRLRSIRCAGYDEWSLTPVEASA